MRRYPIVQVGDPILRQRAKPIPRSLIASRPVQDLIDTMIAAMRRAPGVGLAAPQIGVPIRVIVLEDTPALMRRLDTAERRRRRRKPFKLRVFINPKIRFLSKRKVLFPEGCLSIHGFAANTPHHLDVEVTGFDRTGRPTTWRVDGWPARILQHEMDHLNGKLYIDRMDTRTFANSLRPAYSRAGAAERMRQSIVGRSSRRV
jgi:peptide deformylase